MNALLATRTSTAITSTSLNIDIDNDKDATTILKICRSGSDAKGSKTALKNCNEHRCDCSCFRSLKSCSSNCLCFLQYDNLYGKRKLLKLTSFNKPMRRKRRYNLQSSGRYKSTKWVLRDITVSKFSLANPWYYFCRAQQDFMLKPLACTLAASTN